jgi:hypothetical protein
LGKILGLYQRQIVTPFYFFNTLNPDGEEKMVCWMDGAIFTPNQSPAKTWSASRDGHLLVSYTRNPLKKNPHPIPNPIAAICSESIIQAGFFIKAYAPNAKRQRNNIPRITFTSNPSSLFLIS